MSDLLAARAQMGTSLAFHIIFASLGVGLPLLLCIAEGLALWHQDSGWMTLTRRWTKAFALLFAIGAVSGTILSFEIGLLWPTYTRFSGSIIGLPFALEGFAFFNRDNLSGTLPVWLGASLTARTLALLVSALDQWSCFGVVYRQRQLLDEYANRFPDYVWASDRDQSLTSNTQSEHSL